jgi:hypothetical protein
MIADPEALQWIVVQYEAQMLFAACQLLVPDNPTQLRKLLVVRNGRASTPKTTDDLPFVFRNGVTELAVLHARILIDILISKGSKNDDITLDKLLPGCDPAGVKALKVAYGNGSKGTPCWQFNKFLTHATMKRGASFDYAPALRKVLTPVAGILGSIQKQQPSFDFDVPDN